MRSMSSIHRYIVLGHGGLREKLIPCVLFCAKAPSNAPKHPAYCLSFSTRAVLAGSFSKCPGFAPSNAGFAVRTMYGQKCAMKSKDNNFIASGRHQTLILHNIIIYFHRKVWVCRKFRLTMQRYFPNTDYGVLGHNKVTAARMI
jgi:hypothetical protein